MNTIKNPKLTANAKALRRNMTQQERHLWYDCLKTLPLTVHRQKVIGPYIVDFYCAAAKLVVELDGSQHYSGEQQRADVERDAYFRGLGLTVVRYSNRDINDRFDDVCADICRACGL